MRIFDSELEILKAFSTIWRKSGDCIPSYEEDKDAENYVGGDDPLDFLRLSEEEKETLIDWIDGAFRTDDGNIAWRAATVLNIFTNATQATM